MKPKSRVEKILALMTEDPNIKLGPSQSRIEDYLLLLADKIDNLEREINNGGGNSGETIIPTIVDTRPRDLTVAYADEIANYSGDEWTWIQARLNNHNVWDLRPGDFIPFTVGANSTDNIPEQTHYAEIAGVNPYYKSGDNIVIGYHIDWISRQTYSQAIPWNTTDTNQGTSDETSPFMASFVKQWLDNTLYPLLPSNVKNVIKQKRICVPSRYSIDSTLNRDNGRVWRSFKKLWIPYESEILDIPANSMVGSVYPFGGLRQYPAFKQSMDYIIKYRANFNTRSMWWTASCSNYSNNAIVTISHSGISNTNSATTNNVYVPICFRTMED